MDLGGYSIRESVFPSVSVAEIMSIIIQRTTFHAALAYRYHSSVTQRFLAAVQSVFATDF